MEHEAAFGFNGAAGQYQHSGTLCIVALDPEAHEDVLEREMTGAIDEDADSAVRERYAASIPAVLITGESDLASIQRRLPSGTKLLQKPFDPVALAVPLIDAIREARRIEGL